MLTVNKHFVTVLILRFLVAQGLAQDILPPEAKGKVANTHYNSTYGEELD